MIQIIFIFQLKIKNGSNQDCETFINDLITKHFILLKFSISQELKILLKDENNEAYDYLKTIYESDDQTLKDFVINDLKPYFKQNWNKKDLEDIREFAQETIDLYLKDKFKD